jgi:hypothetical protein
MSNFEGIIEKACKDKEIPGAILAASDNSGRLDWGYRQEQNLTSVSSPIL